MRSSIKILFSLLSCVISYAQKTSRVQDPIEIDPWDPIEETYYRDADADTYGDNNNSIQSTNSSPPFGYVSNNLDCDDTNSSISFYDVTYYYDNDRDGFGDPSITITQSCFLDRPKFYVTNPDDCDDNNVLINPDTEWFFDANSDGIISPSETVVHYGCTPLDENYISGLYENFHYTHSTSYDINGQVISANRTYFDDLGRSNLSLSKDVMTNKIWATETIYDSYGRVSKTSFPTISSYNGFNKIGVLSTSNYSAPIHITGLYNGYYPTTNDLNYYYGDTNSFNEFQATAEFPYSEIEYDKLNPGNVIRQYGGNKNGVTVFGGSTVRYWKTGYSFTVPAAQEMYYVFGHNYYNGEVIGSQEEVITKFYKTINIDPHGIETVVFSDGEGKTLAAARSANSTVSYPVIATIGTQGYVDVYIPSGTSAGVLIGGSSLYKVYDLKTGNITTSGLLPGNAYRVEAITMPTQDFKTFINVSTGGIEFETGAIGVQYNVNYYDYTLNYYDKTNRLYKTIQPNGFDVTTINSNQVKAIPTHTFATTYNYNTLGQLVSTTSPDEGSSKFAYRNDGQIRFSQSAVQIATNAVSYTNYDQFARPIESGVLTGVTWVNAQANVDNPIAVLGGVRSEQTFTIYDFETNYSGVTAPPLLSTTLTSVGLNAANYIQHNLAGNVVTSWNNESQSWYSYDLYGRLEWMVQNVNGLGVKTIHYEYDAKGQVKKVIYEKDNLSELFVHQYTYNFNGGLVSVETSTDNSIFEKHADYEYYIDGKLKRVVLAEGIQGTDYVYTLGGMLKSINHPSLLAVNDPGGDSNDVFGITLDYYNGDYIRPSKPQINTAPTVLGVNDDYFNGNIKATRWGNRQLDVISPTATAKVKAYAFNYNQNNWLQDATYGTVSSSGDILPSTKYKEGELQYDANGNITRLERTDESGGTYDDFVYNYKPGTNQLTSITDTAPLSTVDDIDSQIANNYIYNDIGQLIENSGENLKYFYNTSGLVTEITRNNLPLVQYFYNERGNRIKKNSFDIDGYLQSTDYYVLDASGNSMGIYTQPHGGVSTLSELAVYGAGRLGVYFKNSNETNYQITDHLGNVRAVIRKQTWANPNTISSFADYYPFGETLPLRNSYNNYRYAFQGQEKDNETGMEAFKLRLWDARIGRWLSPDPYGQYHSPYLGMGNNPISLIDLDGGWASGDPGKNWFSRKWNSFKSFLGFKGVNEGYQSIPDEDDGLMKIQLREVIVSKAIPCNTCHHNSQLNPSFWSMFGFDFSIKGGSTIWGNDRSGNILGLKGITKYSYESDDFLTPSSGGGKITFWKHLPNTSKHIIDKAGKVGNAFENIWKAHDKSNEIIPITNSTNTVIMTIHTIHLNDSTINSKSTIMHIKGHPDEALRKLDTFNTNQASRNSFRDAYLNDWGKLKN